MTDDPEVIKRLWAVRSKYKKSEWYDAVRFDPSRDNIISLKDDEQHNALRAKMAAGVSPLCTRRQSRLDSRPLTLSAPKYAGKENEGLEHGVDKGIMAFIDLIEQEYISEGAIYRPMDLARKSQYLTLDIIGDLAFGQDWGHIEQDRDVFEYIASTERSMPVMMLVTVFPGIARMLQSKLLRRLLPSEKDPHGFGKFIG